MAKKKHTILKFNKYPISNEFGIYRLYKIPFNERIFKNDDIYFLTENGNLYTQALQDTNSNCDTYLLSQIDSNVLKIEEDENSDVILVTNNGQRRKITKIMYYDGE